MTDSTKPATPELSDEQLDAIQREYMETYSPDGPPHQFARAVIAADRALRPAATPAATADCMAPDCLTNLCSSRENCVRAKFSDRAATPAATDERELFGAAHKAAGYGAVRWAGDGDQPLHDRDAARYVGWQLARDDLAAAQAPAVPATLNKHIVFDALTRNAQRRTSMENVEDVLAAIAGRTPTACNTEDARSMGAVSDGDAPSNGDTK